MDFLLGLILGYLVGCSAVIREHRSRGGRGIGHGDKPATPPPGAKR